MRNHYLHIFPILLISMALVGCANIGQGLKAAGNTKIDMAPQWEHDNVSGRQVVDSYGNTIGTIR